LIGTVLESINANDIWNTKDAGISPAEIPAAGRDSPRPTARAPEGDSSESIRTAAAARAGKGPAEMGSPAAEPGLSVGARLGSDRLSSRSGPHRRQMGSTAALPASE